MGERIKEFLDEVLGSYCEGIYVREQDHGNSDAPYFLTLEDTEDSYNSFVYSGDYLETDTFGEVSVRAGATRLTFVPEDEDFVIKVPITDVTTHILKYKARKDEVDKYLESVPAQDRNYYWENYFDFEDVHEREINGVTYLEAITSKYPIEEYGDYTKLPADLWEFVDEEASVYMHYARDLMKMENDIRDGLSEDAQYFLAENFFVCNYNGTIPVYIQKKAKLNEGMSTSIEERSSVDDYMSNTKNVVLENRTLYIYAYRKLGSYDKVNEIMRELDEADVLSDLHCNNYGLNNENCLCIIDYAGYDDCYMWNYEWSYA